MKTLKYAENFKKWRKLELSYSFLLIQKLQKMMKTSKNDVFGRGIGLSTKTSKNDENFENDHPQDVPGHAQACSKTSKNEENFEIASKIGWG